MSQLAADRHVLMIGYTPRCHALHHHPLTTARVSEQLHPRCSMQTYHHHTGSFIP